jgi:membrane-bound lytic murein transglycosylase B
VGLKLWHGVAMKMPSHRRFITPAVLSIVLFVASSGQAQNGDGFAEFAAQLGAQAVAQGVNRQTVAAVIPTLYYNAKIVSFDRGQPGGNPNDPKAAIPKFAPYAASHVDNARISRGRIKYQALRGLLSRVERETGVPESIMVAIWGHETNYGTVTGNYDLANSLATLAYEGRRRALFTEEFIATLKMMDRGFPRGRLVGSWAGATGYPQFLPSVYLRLGKDGDGDGRADIWASEPDALASIANYFVASGWRANVPWGVRAVVPANLDRASLANRTVSPRCPRVHDRQSRWKTIAEWRALGVTPTTNKRLRDTDMASFFEPDGPGTPAYLLTGNYRVILDYNCSNFYALSVGLLADAVEK